MKRNLLLSVCMFVVCVTPALSSAFNADNLAAAISRVRIECGFDLSGSFAESINRASLESAGERTFRARFNVQPKEWPSKSKVTFVFNCGPRVERVAEKNASAADQTGERSGAPARRPSAAAVIEEDAGGRYARRIANERRVVAANWRGTIAYVDSLFGDGQRLPMTFFLACDDLLPCSCIEVHVEPSIRHGRASFDPIFLLLRSVAHAQ